MLAQGLPQDGGRGARWEHVPVKFPPLPLRGARIAGALSGVVLASGALVAAHARHGDSSPRPHERVLALSFPTSTTTFAPVPTTPTTVVPSTTVPPRPSTTTAAPNTTTTTHPTTPPAPVTATTQPAPPPTASPPPPQSSSHAAQIAADLFARMNAERGARGVAPLQWDGGLASSATSWSAHLEAIGSLVHSNVNLLLGTRFDEVAENIGYVSGAGATSGAMHVDFMQSTQHRDAMLSGALDVVGIGVTCGPNGTMWVTEQFGRWTTTGPYVPIASTPASPIARSDPGSLTC
jgi:uncharacterized protein YkwD